MQPRTVSLEALLTIAENSYMVSISCEFAHLDISNKTAALLLSYY
jgi:hypothetical protein